MPLTWHYSSFCAVFHVPIYIHTYIFVYLISFLTISALTWNLSHMKPASAGKLFPHLPAVHVTLLRSRRPRFCVSLAHDHISWYMLEVFSWILTTYTYKTSTSLKKNTGLSYLFSFCVDYQNNAARINLKQGSKFVSPTNIGFVIFWTIIEHHMSTLRWWRRRKFLRKLNKDKPTWCH